MEGCFMLMCKYSKSCAAIKISERCSYHEVVEKICAKFKELSVGNCCLFFFSIRGYSNCIVEYDDDLGNMMSMVASSGSHVVDVVVDDRRIVEVVDNSSRINSVICENFLVNDCDDFGGVDKARGGLFGDFTYSIDQLRWYLETGMRTNPGSVFELDVDESSGCFWRLFVAFHGCLYGFLLCRPLLFVDGTFLKGRYKGHLLTATSKDGNQGLFPLAFAIVDAENQDNWMWFLIKCAYAPTVASFQHYMEKLRRIAGNGRVNMLSNERFDFDGACSSIIKPPIMKKQLGRNKKKMIPSRGENVKQIKCVRCLKYGNHNKKTCKATI
ncbi:hypothetical protein ACSBR1_021239 [Camellia fascicularis]